MNNDKYEQFSWQRELEESLADEGRPSRGWYQDDWQAGKTSNQTRNTQVTYGNWYKTTTNEDLNRWKKGGVSYTTHYSSFSSTKDIATIVVDQVVRTANAVANHKVTDKDGKEQFLSLRMGDDPSQHGGIANTCLQPTVFVSNGWIEEARRRGVITSVNNADQAKVNEEINKLASAYSGQALVLATAKTTMDKEVAKAANELSRIAFNSVSISDERITYESALSLWGTAEYEIAKKAMLKDWPGFSNYTDAAQDMAPAKKISESIYKAAQEIEDMRAYVHRAKARLAAGTNPTGDLVQTINMVNQMILDSQVKATAAALNYVTSGRKEKIKLPPEILAGVKHVIKQPIPSGTTLEQAVTVSKSILEYYRKDKPEDPGKQPGDGDDEGKGEGEGEGGDGTPTEAGENPGQPGNWDVSQGREDPTQAGHSAEVGKRAVSSGSSDDVESSMQPSEIAASPDELCKDDIHMSSGVTRGWMVNGFPPAMEAQKEMLRQLAEPIARVVKSKILFRASAPSIEIVGLRKGDIDEGNLYMAKHDSRVFSRKEEVIKPTVAVGILLDQSGSMSDKNSSEFRPNMSRVNEALIRQIPALGKKVNLHTFFHTKSVEVISVLGLEHCEFGHYMEEKNGKLHLSRADQVAAVAAGIYIGLDQMPGVELFVSGFHSGSINGVLENERAHHVFVPPALPQYHQRKRNLPYPMRLMEYASRHVGKMTLDKMLARLCYVYPDYANADGFAIMHAAARMNQLYPEIKAKVLFVISDGKPSCMHHPLGRTGTDWIPGYRDVEYAGDRAMKHIREISRWSHIHQGVTVRGIGVGNAYTTIEGRLMYGENNFTVLKDVVSSANVIAAFLARTFHKTGV